MELNDLKKIWKKQQAEDNLNYSPEELLLLINNKLIAFDKEIEERNRLELIGCAIVVIVFSFFFFITPSFWSKIGCVIIVLSAFFIGYRMKKYAPNANGLEPNCDHSIAQHLKQELEQVQKQKRLLQNVAWWYIMPICAGLIIFTIGTSWLFTIKLIYIGIVLLMGVGIWWINQRVVNERFNPFIIEIENSLHSLETNGRQSI